VGIARKSLAWASMALVQRMDGCMTRDIVQVLGLRRWLNLLREEVDIIKKFRARISLDISKSFETEL
jgi:hypothetical protein